MYLWNLLKRFREEFSNCFATNKAESLICFECLVSACSEWKRDLTCFIHFTEMRIWSLEAYVIPCTFGKKPLSLKCCSFAAHAHTDSVFLDIRYGQRIESTHSSVASIHAQFRETDFIAEPIRWQRTNVRTVSHLGQTPNRVF